MPGQMARSAARIRFGLPKVTAAARAAALSCHNTRKPQKFAPVRGSFGESGQLELWPDGGNHDTQAIDWLDRLHRNDELSCRGSSKRAGRYTRVPRKPRRQSGLTRNNQEVAYEIGGACAGNRSPCDLLALRCGRPGGELAGPRRG